MPHLNIRRFDPSKMQDNRVSVFLGPPGSGKSTAVKYIFAYKADIPFGLVISPTECMNHFFEKFIPKILIHDEYSDELLNDLVDRQTKLAKKVDKGTLNDDVIDRRSFLCMDDCLADDDWTRKKPIRKLFMIGRHLKCSTFITLQAPLGVLPQLRSNIHYVFIQKYGNYKDMLKIYENYAPVFRTKQEFFSTLETLTENFCTMVIDNTTNSSKLSDRIFWMKAEENVNFKMMPQEVWDYSEKTCKDDDDDDDDDNDLELFSKNNGLVINKLS